MSVLKVINIKVGKRRRANLAGIIKYVLKTEKTDATLVYGQCLEVERAYKMMIETKETFNKLSGREYYHFMQAYPPEENITPEQALEQAKKLLETTKKFRGYEVLVVVHKDKAHIHVHYIVNSVSFVTGRKFHMTRNELQALKELQNQISIRDGFLPAPKKGQKSDGITKRTELVANNKDTYQFLTKADKGQVDSYVQNCAIAVLTNKDKALNREQFIKLMAQSGFETIWNEQKKHITFIDKKRQMAGESKCKIRLARLAEYYPEFENLGTKEELTHVLNENNENSRISAELNGIREELNSNREQLDNQGIAITNTGIQITEQSINQSERTASETEQVGRVETGKHADKKPGKGFGGMSH